LGGAVQIRNIKGKLATPRKAQAGLSLGVRNIMIPINEDDSADFNEKDISEKSADFAKEVWTILNRPLVPKVQIVKPKRHKLPQRVSAVQTITTPEPDKTPLPSPGKMGNSAPPFSTPLQFQMFIPAPEEDSEVFHTAVEDAGNPPKIKVPEIDTEFFITVANGEAEDGPVTYKETNDSSALSVHSGTARRKYGEFKDSIPQLQSAKLCTPQPACSNKQTKEGEVKKRPASDVSAKNAV
jgi:hypothetical protein